MMQLVFHALKYEIRRQIDVLEDGGEIVQETRRWVGDLAHCLIYEADLRGYTFSYADGFGGFFGNRGEWDTSFVGEDQMSHCER